MSPPEALRERVRRLNQNGPRRGRYVLYWMQQSQRVHFNHALEHSAHRANELGLPLLVAFGLTDRYPEANLRHDRFLLEGLREAAGALAARGIGFVLRRGAPDEVALGLAADAAAVVCDRGYLRHQRRWRQRVADEAGCEVSEVEADAVVPVAIASGSAAVAARVLRPRIHAVWDRFLVPLAETPLRRRFSGRIGGLDLDDVDAVLQGLTLDRSVAPVAGFPGGTTAARRRLRAFLARGLRGYAGERAGADLEAVSRLSPYLHFGQISPIEVALAARATRAPAGDRDSFLEELIVRRELAQNFCWYVEDYDQWSAVPGWARATLHGHERDPRPHRYDRAALEAARTHDPVWNTAMREMIDTGYLHNRLRMYWGKKILEWSPTPEVAHQVALALNNKYFLDGRDPSSYANVAWLFGLHDRPFAERAIYGVVRSMTAAGLERKMDVAAYVAGAHQLSLGEGGP